MKKQNNSLGFSDILFVPAALALTYILGHWMLLALAAAISFVMFTLVLSLFSSRKGSFKGFMVSVLLVAIFVYVLVALGWPP